MESRKTGRVPDTCQMRFPRHPEAAVSGHSQTPPPRVAQQSPRLSTDADGAVVEHCPVSLVQLVGGADNMSQSPFSTGPQLGRVPPPFRPEASQISRFSPLAAGGSDIWGVEALGLQLVEGDHHVVDRQLRDGALPRPVDHQVEVGRRDRQNRASGRTLGDHGADDPCPRAPVRRRGSRGNHRAIPRVERVLDQLRRVIGPIVPSRVGEGLRITDLALTEPELSSHRFSQTAAVRPRQSGVADAGGRASGVPFGPYLGSLPTCGRRREIT